RHAVHAVRRRHLTHADPADGLAEPLVGDAVAVVVEPVAHLGAGRDVADARAPLAHRARLHALVAHAHAERGRRARVAGLRRTVGAQTTVVDLAVAVIVEEPVALLRLRREWYPRLWHAVDAVLHRHLARADAARRRAEPVVD